MHVSPGGLSGASHVLLLDPGPARLGRLAEALLQHGHRASRCDSAEAALESVARLGPGGRVDLLFVAPLRPGRAAVELVRRVRAVSALPVVVLAAAEADLGERVAALEAGADDHLSAATPLPEVLARLRALLRRAAWGGAHLTRELPALPAASPAGPAARDGLLIEGGWVLEPHRRAVARPDGSDSVALTGAEFELLRLLSLAAGEPVDREAISRAVFRRPWRVEDRAVDGLVKRLRQKLRADAIAAVRGVGYALRLAGPARLPSPIGRGSSAMHLQVEICGATQLGSPRREQPQVVFSGAHRLPGCGDGES